VCLLTVQWSSAQDDQAVYDFADRFVARAKARTERAGKAHRWMYINYAKREQDPFGGYGEANLRRLKKIQRAADPEGVFTSTGLCRGYFKLN
jgi:FAD/FMN-containing dehydrogenase